jgi:ADP-heptose:LPS heptosyltransferase
MPVKILIKFSHGLGDVVQSTVILKHLRKYRPDWIVDYRCGRGKHTAAIGLCNRVWHDQEPEPPHENYSTVVMPGFWENYNRELGVPNSKVVNCLKEVFGIQYDPTLGQYEVHIGETAKIRTAKYLESIGCKRNAATGRYNAVICHYEGNTSAQRKNLRHWQASSLLETAIRAGRAPVVLDWDGRSPLADNKRVFKPHTGPGDLWGGFGSGCAETIAALISQSEAYLGVDSGPGKVASATSTPTLIIWTGHHPLQFHDPAPNTTHLIPENHRQMPPLNNDKEMSLYFERTYRWIPYPNGPRGLVSEASKWLSKVLDWEADVPTVQYVTPNGIGDVYWVLKRIKSIAKAEHNGAPIDIILSGNPGRDIDRRCTYFLKRFPFVRSATVRFYHKRRRRW